MSIPDIQSKLIGSPSFHSLTAEQEILALLQSNDWQAVHGCFYVDSKTDKLREIDVLGRRIWERKLKSGVESADVHLIIEVKSVKGYHLLFSALAGSAAYRQANEFWIGYEGEHRDPIITTLANIGLSPDNAASVLKALQKAAYPKDTPRLSRLQVDPPPAEVYASAFRETNVGGEKDLEGSVLWKASLSLASMVSSLKQQTINYIVESLKDEAEAASMFKLDPIAQIIKFFDYFVRTVDLYHPILVIDAPLWLVKKGELSEIKWCRFQQLDTHGRAEWWFDVVHSGHFNKFVQDLTKYYVARFKSARAKQGEFSRSLFLTYPHVTEREREHKRQAREIRTMLKGKRAAEGS